MTIEEIRTFRDRLDGGYLGPPIKATLPANGFDDPRYLGPPQPYVDYQDTMKNPLNVECGQGFVPNADKSACVPVIMLTLDPNANPVTAIRNPNGTVTVSHAPINQAATTVKGLLDKLNVASITAKLESNPMLAVGLIGLGAYLVFGKKKGRR